MKKIPEPKVLQLGKIQKAWVESLRKHPERQTKLRLGYGSPSNYHACCLGELLIVKCRLQKKKLPFAENKDIIDREKGVSSKSYLSASYKQLGLRSDIGGLKKKIKGYNSLSIANDKGMSWPEIADFIENNPELVFTKSV